MAEQLIDSLSAEFDPTKFQDEYRERVLDLIERKAAGEEIAVQPEAEEPAPAPDLMAALEASLAAVRSDDGDDGEASGRGAAQGEEGHRAKSTKRLVERQERLRVVGRSRSKAKARPKPADPALVSAHCAGTLRGAAVPPCLFTARIQVTLCTESLPPGPPASTTPRTSTTAAASRWWRSCGARPATP